MTKKNVTRAAVGLGAALALTACNGSFAGTGFLPSAGQTRGLGAFVDFRVTCVPNTFTTTGSVRYIDGASRVTFIGSATGVHSTIDFANETGNQGQCDGDPTQGHYEGTYVPMYGTGAPGIFDFDVQLNSPTCGTKPQIDVVLTGGVFNGYSNHQCLSFGSVRPLG